MLSCASGDERVRSRSVCFAQSKRTFTAGVFYLNIVYNKINVNVKVKIELNCSAWVEPIYRYIIF